MSNTINVLVVDDSAVARMHLVHLLELDPQIRVIKTVNDGQAALDFIQENQPDVILMDVNMPGLDGMGVARRLRENGAVLPHFIFVTAYDQHAVEAFRLEALDYLLKPVDKVRLAESVERAARSVQEKRSPDATPGPPAPAPAPRTKLAVRSNNRHFIVDANDVIYATIDDGLITLVTTQLEGHSNYRTIEDLQANLDRDQFWRVHRSYLVNINRIKEVVPWFKSSYQLRMDDKKHTEIPVSRVQTRRLRELFKL